MPELTKQTNAPVVGSGAPPAYNPRDYQESSAAVSFAALMDVLKAYQEMRDANAAEMQTLTKANVGAIEAQATSTYNSYKDDADNLMLQRNEQYTSMGSSLMTVAGGAASMYMTKSASTDLDHMNNLVAKSKELQPTQLIGGDRVPGAEHTELLNKHSEDIVNGYGFKQYKNGMDSTLEDGKTPTLRHVFETASTEKVDGKPSELNQLKQALTKAHSDAHTAFQSRQSYITTITNTMSTFGNIGSSGANSVFKTGESDNTLDKAKQNQEQAYAAASKEFMQQTYGSAQQAVNQGVDGVNKTFQTLSQMVGIDTRA